MLIDREKLLDPTTYPGSPEDEILNRSKNAGDYDFIRSVVRVETAERLLRESVITGKDTPLWRRLLLEEVYDYMLEWGPSQADLLERYSVLQRMGDRSSIEAFKKIFSIETKHIKRWITEECVSELGEFPIDDDVWIPGAGVPVVYHLCNETLDTVYIGQSINLRSRLRSHFLSSEKMSKATQWSYSTCKSVVHMNLLESYEIEMMKPVLNKAGIETPIFSGVHGGYSWDGE
jgi:GIY-YIG catalytic domain